MILHTSAAKQFYTLLKSFQQYSNSNSTVNQHQDELSFACMMNKNHIMPNAKRDDRQRQVTSLIKLSQGRWHDGSAHSPDNALGPGADGTELLVPPQYCEGGIAHLHAVEVPLPLSHGSAHWLLHNKSDLTHGRGKEKRKTSSIVQFPLSRCTACVREMTHASRTRHTEHRWHQRGRQMSTRGQH